MLSLKEAEKAVLSERVSILLEELGTAALELDRLAREAAHYKDQERVILDRFRTLCPFCTILNCSKLH